MSEIAGIVQSGFDADGIPPHRLPSASNLTYKGNSKIFVVKCATFIEMEPEVIQSIFRHRHILVTDVPPGKRVEFNARGLSMLAPLDYPVDIQRMSFAFMCFLRGSDYCCQSFTDADRKTDSNSKSMLSTGTLQELLDNVQENSPVALNVLDLPLGDAAVPIPPMFTDLATDAYSTPCVKDLVKIWDLRDTLSWGTAATKNAVSWFHIEDDGFATAVSVQAGSKWWVLADRIRDDPRSDDMRDTKAFDGWKVRHIDGKRWRLEGVLLVPHSTL